MTKEFSITTDSGDVVIPDGKWVAEVSVDSFLKPHPEDRRIPRTNLPLTEPVKWWSQVLGVKAGEVQKILQDERRTTPQDYGYVSVEQDWLLVSDKYFVAVNFRDHDEWYGGDAKSHRGLVLSRQIHKGELGQNPPLSRKPQVFPSQILDPDKGHWDLSNPYEPKFIRPNLNWVQLSELTQIVGLTPEEIIAGFAGFSASTYYEPNVPLLLGGVLGEIVRIYTGSVPQSFCSGEYQWGGGNTATISSLPATLNNWGNGVFVTQSFAYAVIRLVQFGYKPENEMPENSFRLEAPMPQAPEGTLPVLSVEKLRELHELRAQLPSELSKETFRAYAEAALGTSYWHKAPYMDDKSQGFSYNTQFERLHLDDENGCITICTCYWTRAGADKTRNYYSGMLAVFPEKVFNPRTDETAILRIWFWPGELVRQTPTGSKGGLCPPEVPENLASRVKDFLRGLGYTI